MHRVLGLSFYIAPFFEFDIDGENVDVLDYNHGEFDEF